MKLLIIILTFLTIPALAGVGQLQDTHSCSFRAVGYEIDALLYPVCNSQKCALMMDVLIDDEFYSFYDKEIRTWIKTNDEILQDEELQWILKSAKIKASNIKELTFYKVSLDDDGGGVLLLKAIMKGSKAIQSSGLLTFMGGIRGSRCEG